MEGLKASDIAKGKSCGNECDDNALVHHHEMRDYIGKSNQELRRIVESLDRRVRELEGKRNG